MMLFALTLPPHGAWLLVGAAAYIGYRVLRGWRDGLARQLFAVLAVVVAIPAGYACGPTLMDFFRTLLAVPDFLLLPLAQLAVGLAVYLFVVLLGKLLFPRTDALATIGSRLISGIGGALVSGAVGCMIVWAVFQFLRLASMVQGKKPAWQEPLRYGLLADVLETTDPLSDAELKLLQDLHEVMNDPVLARYFINYPPWRFIQDRPGIRGLTYDEDVQQMLAQGKYQSLLMYPQVVKALNDPEVRRAFSFTELRKAVDYAHAQAALNTPP